MREFKANNLITPKEAVAYGNSSHVQGLVANVKSMRKNQKQKVTKMMDIDVRNLVMYLLSIGSDVFFID